MYGHLRRKALQWRYRKEIVSMNKNNLSKNLYELRRRNGLSQEEMAEKLFVSRQAISKWERGEAYPDTENLIVISNIFGITLDELVHGDLAVTDEVGEDENDAESNDDSSPTRVSVNMTESGLHIKVRDEDEDENIVVNLPGIHIDVNGNGKNDEDEDDDDEPYDKRIARGSGILRVFRALPYPILITAAFLILGFTVHAWAWAWTLFITIPVYYSLIDAIRHRRFSDFAYPVFLAFVYCLIGMTAGGWHPWWIIFITIPIYYPVAEAIDRWIRG